MQEDTKPRRVLTLEQILSLQAQEILICNQYDDFTIAAADEQSDGLSGMLNVLAAYIPALQMVEGVVAAPVGTAWQGMIRKVGKHTGRYKSRLLRLQPHGTGGQLTLQVLSCFCSPWRCSRCVWLWSLWVVQERVAEVGPCNSSRRPRLLQMRSHVAYSPSAPSMLSSS
jgi:hypothetical protein